MEYLAKLNSKSNNQHVIDLPAWRLIQTNTFYEQSVEVGERALAQDTGKSRLEFMLHQAFNSTAALSTLLTLSLSFFIFYRKLYFAG